jgi:hypothetical protein
MPETSNTHCNDIDIQKEIIKSVAQIVSAAPGAWSAKDKADLVKLLIAAYYDGLDEALSKYITKFET